MSKDTESLFVFNPKEEAILDHNLAPLSLSHNKMLKEAMEHLKMENLYLKEQIVEQQELVTVHKQMLQQVLA